MTQIVEPIIQHLEAGRLQMGVVGVAGVAGLFDALAQQKGAVHLYVLKTADAARPSSSMTMVTRQQGEERFSVVAGLTLAALKGRRGLLDALTGDVKARLVGWSHPAGDAPVEYRAGSVMLMDEDRQILFWQMEFAFTTLIEG